MALLFSGAAWFGGFFYYLELTTHFRLHYLLLALLCTLIFVWAGRWKWLAVSLLAVGLNVPPLLPAYLPAEAGAAGSASLRLMLANVNGGNDKYAGFINTVLNRKPEVIIVLEATPEWARALKHLEADYPHTVRLQRRDNFGILLFSKLALDSQKILEFGVSSHPSLLFRLTKQGRELAIIATHLMPPVDSEAFTVRNRELDDAAAWMARLKGARMLVGDLNTTPWSPYFKAMRNRGGLRDGRNGFGILPTWPTMLPGLMIPIDHLLVSPEVGVHELAVGDDIGSDHLPLFAEVLF